MKKISIEELLIWFKHYERYVEGDPIDAVDWRGDFLEFVMYLVNNLEDKEELEDPVEEKEIKEMYDFNEKKITTLRQDRMPEWLEKGDIKVFKDTQEKQEEWRELRNFLEGWISNPNIVDEVMNKVSQLLSERTFNKEELNYLFLCVDVRDKYTKGNSDKNLVNVENIKTKLSKLLKEEE